MVTQKLGKVAAYRCGGGGIGGAQVAQQDCGAGGIAMEEGGFFWKGMDRVLADSSGHLEARTRHIGPGQSTDAAVRCLPDRFLGNRGFGCLGWRRTPGCGFFGSGGRAVVNADRSLQCQDGVVGVVQHALQGWHRTSARNVAKTQPVAIPADGDVERQVIGGDRYRVDLIKAHTIRVQRLFSGTLEMTRLNSGWFCAVPVTMPAPKGEIDVMPWAIFCRRGILVRRSLACEVESTMRLSRLRGVGDVHGQAGQQQRPRARRPKFRHAVTLAPWPPAAFGRLVWACRCAHGTRTNGQRHVVDGGPRGFADVFEPCQ